MGKLVNCDFLTAGRRRRLEWCLVVVCGLAGGCGPSGPPRVAVSGTVTFDDAPLESGTIAFVPAEGVVGPMAGGEIKNGTYRIEAINGPTLGEHRVEIRAWREGAEQITEGVGGATEGPSAGGTAAIIEMYIPSRYNTQSTLSAVIEKGENQHDFSLQAEP